LRYSEHQKMKSLPWKMSVHINRDRYHKASYMAHR